MPHFRKAFASSLLCILIISVSLSCSGTPVLIESSTSMNPAGSVESTPSTTPTETADTPDTNVPTTGTGITFSSVKTTSMSVN